MSDPIPARESAGEALVVMISHPEEGARAFARGLVERRLAACVQLVPVTSVYRWEGRVQEDGEVLLVLKTRRERLAALRAVLEREHPYDVPECVALEPAAVTPAYLAWLLDESAEPDAG